MSPNSGAITWPWVRRSQVRRNQLLPALRSPKPCQLLLATSFLVMAAVVHAAAPAEPRGTIPAVRFALDYTAAFRSETYSFQHLRAALPVGRRQLVGYMLHKFTPLCAAMQQDTGTCFDGKHNGRETGTDCGGFNGSPSVACPACGTGAGCQVRSSVEPQWKYCGTHPLYCVLSRLIARVLRPCIV